METVPGKARWWSEQPGRITGATRALPSFCAKRTPRPSPIIASVPSGRCGPCCSDEPATMIAVVLPSAMAASMSCHVIRSSSTSGSLITDLLL